jgi:hypothetical protein
VDAYEDFQMCRCGVYPGAAIAKVDFVNTPWLSSTFRNGRFSFQIRLKRWEGSVPKSHRGVRFDNLVSDMATLRAKSRRWERDFLACCDL